MSSKLTSYFHSISDYIHARFFCMPYYCLLFWCNLSIHVSLTGIRGGTAALIEKELKRKLIWLPCRHHIFEIVLRAVFEVYWPVTSGPNVSIFGRFKTFWDKIDQSNYETGVKDEFVNDAVKAERIEIITFINNHLAVCYY